MEAPGRQMTHEQLTVIESDEPVPWISTVAPRWDDAIHTVHHQDAGFLGAVIARSAGRLRS